VPPSVVKWWICQHCKINNPEPGALIIRHCSLLRQEDREALGSFILDAWIRALNVANGKQVWRFAGKDNADYGYPAIADNLVIFKTSKDVLYGIRASDGKKLWQVALSRKSDILLHQPVIIANQVLVTADSKLMAYDLSGKQLWKWDCAEGLTDYPVIPLDDGVIVSGYHELCRFQMSQPASLPAQAAERHALAAKLVSRLDRLTNDEKRTLVKLGDDAFEPLLHTVQERLIAAKDWNTNSLKQVTIL
jgi:hypothetical protein